MAAISYVVRAVNPSWERGTDGLRVPVNRPLVDTGWRVGMPVGSNPPSTTPIQSHLQAARGAIAQASAWELSVPHPGKSGLVSPIQFVRVWGYGVFGK